ncbi:MAG: hypothetical protein WCH43_08920 [Verrucomicrobiota bacterium]
MKSLLAALLIVCAGMIHAQDSEPEETPAPPVTPIQVEGGAINISTVKVDLLNIVAAISHPDGLKVALSKLTPPQIADVILALAASSSDLKVVLAKLTPEQVSDIILGLAGNPAKLTAVVHGIPLAQLTEAKITTPGVVEILRWVPVIDWLAQKPSNSRNWVAGAQAQLNADILKSGYTTEILVRAEKVMERSRAQ